MKIALEIDGTWYEAEANAKTFNGVASKQRFKERFGVPAAYLSVYTSLVDDDSDEGVDWSKLSSEQMAALPDPDVAFAFLLWLELKRRCDSLPADKWDDLIERITDVWVDAGDGEGDADPSPQTST